MLWVIYWLRKQHTTEEKLIRELKRASNLSANKKKKDFKIEKKIPY